MTEPEASNQGDEFRCDFCGVATPHVRRVALAQGYDRLHRPHKEQYACEDCSRKKDSEREG